MTSGSKGWGFDALKAAFTAILSLTLAAGAVPTVALAEAIDVTGEEDIEIAENLSVEDLAMEDVCDADADGAALVVEDSAEALAPEQDAAVASMGQPLVDEVESAPAVAGESLEDVASASQEKDAVISLLAMSSGNDTISNATSFSLNTYVKATTTSSEDGDFYKVALPSAGTYTLSFAGDTQLGDGDRDGWYITVYDYDRNPVIDGVYYNGGHLDRANWTGYFPAGTCYVQVAPSWRIVAGSKYRFRLSKSGYKAKDENTISSLRPIDTDELEGNDSLATANRMGRNKYVYASTTSADDQDFFALRLPVAGTYTLSFAGDTQLGDGDRDGWYITVYDYDRNPVIDGVYYNGGHLDRANWTGYFPAGTCYVQVAPSWRIVGGSSYHFRIAGASLSSASVSGIKAKTYNGKAQKQSPIVRVGGRTLKLNEDYVLTYVGNTKVGVAKIKLQGKGSYIGTITRSFKINKAKNPIVVKAVSKSAKRAQTKKRAVTVARPMNVTKAQGKLSYAKASGAKCLSVNKKTGKVTVKKGTKKGIYKIKIKVTAAGTKNYKKGSKTVTCKVTVK